MTTEKRDEIRADCETAEELINELHRERLEYNEYLTLIDAVQGAEVVIDALDEADAEAGTATHRAFAQFESRLTELADDRDRWKARAEALERAIKTDRKFDGCNCCYYKELSVYYDPCASCAYIESGPNDSWQFDMARFAGTGAER